MSEADELFKKLGYKKLNKEETKQRYKEIFDLIECCYVIGKVQFIIFFKDKRFSFATPVTMQELEAIIQKCKELEWLDES